MDANKLKVLREIGYTIRMHCGLCEWAEISGDGWGVCKKHTYKHQKHNVAESPLSINESGYCESFEMSDMQAAVQGLHHYREFIK